MGPPRPGALELLQARARRLRPLRPALDPRRRDRRAALRQGDRPRRSRSPGSPSPRCRTSSPAIFLILVFGIWLGWLPVTAQWDDGASLADTARVPAPARADAHARPLRVHRPHHSRRDDRGARLGLRAHRLPQGASVGVVVRRHVLRNALLPTIAVVAVQIGYLFGGLVAVEFLFNYHGIGALILDAAKAKDLPLLTSGVLVVGIVYLVVTLIADILYARPQPADPARSGGVTSRRRPRRRAPGPARSEARTARSERAPPARSARRRVVDRRARGRLLGLLRDLHRPRHPVRPDLRQRVPAQRAADLRSPVRHRHQRARRALARARGLARHPA